ncbi:MAG: hypothetical protein HPY75_12865 [Actinobacteria bacterium]|nr:hypothetical protein [Actinomycetota bacterium]
MMAACVVLVGISYLMLDILSGMVVVPRTPVREVESPGELVLPATGMEIVAMDVSSDGEMIALLERPAQGGISRLSVLTVSGGGGAFYEREVSGRSLAWLYGSRRLVYEDGGDIHLLDAESTQTMELTKGPEIDYDPLPSPDGRHILWTMSEKGAQAGGAAEIWVMDSGGGDPRMLAPLAELAAWDPSGGKVISRGKGYGTGDDRGSEYYLQVAEPGKEGWEYLAPCEGEPRFLWWPALGETLYVAPWRSSDQARTRAVWFKVGETGEAEKAATSESLGDDSSRYRFYPSRRGARVAYVGERGLEYLDYEQKRIYRFTRVSASSPLAWDEAGGWLFYCGEGGVYRVAFRGG